MILINLLHETLIPTNRTCLASLENNGTTSKEAIIRIFEQPLKVKAVQSPIFYPSSLICPYCEPPSIVNTDKRISQNPSDYGKLL